MDYGANNYYYDLYRQTDRLHSSLDSIQRYLLLFGFSNVCCCPEFVTPLITILSSFQLCTPRVQPAVPEEHYKAVCRALATESLELRVFLQKVFHGGKYPLKFVHCS